MNPYHFILGIGDKQLSEQGFFNPTNPPIQVAELHTQTCGLACFKDLNFWNAWSGIASTRVFCARLQTLYTFRKQTKKLRLLTVVVEDVHVWLQQNSAVLTNTFPLRLSIKRFINIHNDWLKINSTTTIMAIDVVCGRYNYNTWKTVREATKTKVVLKISFRCLSVVFPTRFFLNPTFKLTRHFFMIDSLFLPKMPYQ